MACSASMVSSALPVTTSWVAVPQALKQHAGHAAPKTCRQVLCIPVNDLSPGFEIVIRRSLYLPLFFLRNAIRSLRS
jgi:hypothetical protein